ncbi:uncharacterized protein FOMMEDRAFT_170636 [Fomitiporia mediterranea MF3/22]|uniref:uncharacterized protein n=1 Tax=Fomitiporia mediterranea (strain MF3/22) TaxID=694068 RepID=UPI00044074D3|nr:uncharacterized protein FOMMEDRAFT_170636 [Fomitiporia mediterranea MF3/22]EJC99349.1 hypothetical protein FOMMEDRAFT_170636 [Fomitiporia mediterranea MF3/22]
MLEEVTVVEPNGITASLDDLKALSSEFGRAVPLLAELVATNHSKKTESNHPRRGLKRLPDDLLIVIFKQAYYSLAGFPINIPSVRSNLLIKRVSQVCKRFRSLALSCPEFWSVIYSSMPKGEAALWVERSRSKIKGSPDCGLTIIIHGKDHTRFASDMSVDDLREFMEALAPAKGRWRELRITSTPSRPISQLMSEVQQHIKDDSDELDSLQQLHLHRYKWDSDVDVSCNIKKWCAPNLRLFHGTGVVPDVPTNFQAESITHLSLTCQVNAIPNMFLGNETPFPNLRHLFLRILNVSDREAIAYGHSDEPIRLPSLETLEVISSIPGAYTTFWVLIAPRLEVPHLERLYVRTALDNVVDLFSRLGSHQFASLRDLRFVCEDLGIVLMALRSLSKFPHLRHVTIDDCCYSSYKPADFAFASLPPLSTLTFSGCRFNNLHGIEVLAERLRLCLDFDMFERLRIEYYDEADLRWDRANILSQNLEGKVEFVDALA